MVGSVLRVRYELTELMHEGPIFIAYAAKDRLHGSDVCVRVIREPFAREADFVQAIRDLVERYSGVQHPGVEAMLEVDEDEGRPFLVSELTNAMPLADRIRKLAPFSVPVAASTAISLCEALEALHALGLSHGDVSAQNVASLPDGQVRVQIPGMWQAYAASPIAAGIALPSMSPYLSPEISAGSLPSPASDVYAVGVLLYELLTGRLPYNADTPVSMALKHATGTVPSVRMYNPSVPAVLDEIVKKALAKGPAQRYQSAGALLSDLRVLQDALRFGRTVTWPITPDSVAPQIVDMQKTAPRKEAVAKVKPQRDPPDIPVFMWILIAVFGGVVAALLGVFFFFSLNKPPLAKVPEMAKLTVQEAQQVAKSAKLLVEVEGEKSSETIPAGEIISSDPSAGERVREGSHVRVVVSSGSRLIVVPDLKGNTVEQARSLLMAAHLDLDDQQERRHSKTVQAGLIIGQMPKSGNKVEATTKVKVVVSMGDDGSAIDDTGNPVGGGGETHLYTLKVKLNGLDRPVTVRIDIVDDTGTRTVHEQLEEPGSTIELATRGVGKEVTFMIYYDGQLMKEVPKKASESKEDKKKTTDPGDNSGDRHGDTGGGTGDNNGDGGQ